MKSIDLNSDLGESFGAYTIGCDAEVLSFVTSANVACGFHAGDPLVMKRTVTLALARDTAIGAHPGLPDLVGFGRRKMAVSPDEAYAMVLYQVGALAAFVHAAGGNLQHVKPHGALYNMAAKDASLAEAIAKAVYDVSPALILYGLAGSELIREGQRAGLKTASEVFADRAYMPDGTLMPRSHPGAVLSDPEAAIRQVLSMVDYGTVTAADGTVVPVTADTICVHGDNAKALAFTKCIRDRLTEGGIQVRNFQW